MDTYVILRRSGWRSPEELGRAADRSTADVPVDEIVRVADTVVVREDPAPAAT
jgi:hypothetical protein